MVGLCSHGSRRVGSHHSYRQLPVYNHHPDKPGYEFKIRVMRDRKVIQPPRLADRLFEWYCANANIEDLHGDMEELFFRNLESMPAWRAKQIYWRQTLSLIFSYAIKKRKRTSSLPSTSYHFLHYYMI